MGRDLEISEDLAFQRRSWRMQRVGWAMMAILLAAGLAGVFGVGPASSASAVQEDLKVSYERFPRAATDTDLVIEFQPREDVSRIAVESRYLEQGGLLDVWPLPASMESVDGRAVIAVATPMDESDERPRRPSMLTMRLHPSRVGWLSTNVHMDGRPAVRVRHLVLP